MSLDPHPLIEIPDTVIRRAAAGTPRVSDKPFSNGYRNEFGSLTWLGLHPGCAADDGIPIASRKNLLALPRNRKTRGRRHGRCI